MLLASAPLVELIAPVVHAVFGVVHSAASIAASAVHFVSSSHGVTSASTSSRGAWDTIAASLADPAPGAGAGTMGSAAAPADAPPASLDPVQLVLKASLPVKLVLVILVLFSVACWIVIGAKTLHLRRARGESRTFLQAFDKAPSLEALARDLAQFRGSPYARIFAVGYDEMVRMTKGERVQLSDAQATHVESVTRRAASQEVTHLESWMALLGTIGSTSPFIGLFGTVYGIMDAFLSIGNQQSANLPVVAPKIAEALIATAIGLVAAIPAVMAYNYFARRVQTLAETMEGFALDVAARARMGGR